MKKRYIILLITILLFCTGATSEHYLSPVPLDTQKIVYSNGEEVLISEDNESSVAASLLKVEKTLTLHVAYMNRSDKPINALPDQITSMGYNKNEDSKGIKVYSYDEYIDKIKHKKAWSEFWWGFSVGAGGYNNTSTTTVNGYQYGSGWYGNFWGSATTTTTDYNRMNNDLASIRDKYNRQIAFYNMVLIKRNTINPNQVIDGYVMIEYNSIYSKQISISIPFGNTTHEFRFEDKK